MVGCYWSRLTNQIVDFQIELYEDSTGYQQPKQEPIYAERISFSEIDLGGYYRYEATIPQVTILDSQVYWNLKDKSCSCVQNGTYFILLETETTRDILKLVILR